MEDFELKFSLHFFPRAKDGTRSLNSLMNLHNIPARFDSKMIKRCPVPYLVFDPLGDTLHIHQCHNIEEVKYLLEDHSQVDGIKNNNIIVVRIIIPRNPTYRTAGEIIWGTVLEVLEWAKSV